MRIAELERRKRAEPKREPRIPESPWGEWLGFQKRACIYYNSVTLLVYTHFAAALVRGPLRWLLPRRPRHVWPADPPKAFQNQLVQDSIRRSMKGLKPFLSLAVGFLACVNHGGLCWRHSAERPIGPEYRQFTVYQRSHRYFLQVLAGGLRRRAALHLDDQFRSVASRVEPEHRWRHQRYANRPGQVQLHSEGCGLAVADRRPSPRWPRRSPSIPSSA